MGYLTFGTVLSEPLKIKLLRTPLESTITATFLDNGIYWFTCALVAIGGWICAAVGFTHGAHYVANIAAVTLLSLGLFLIVRRRPILSETIQMVGSRSPSWLIRGEAIEQSIRGCRLRQPALVGRMFWTGVACQSLLLAEVAVVMWSHRVPIHLVTVLAVEGITRALTMASGWVPARLGADEDGAMSAFMMAGFSPVSGLTLAHATHAGSPLDFDRSDLAFLDSTQKHSDGITRKRYGTTAHNRAYTRRLTPLRLGIDWMHPITSNRTDVAETSHQATSCKRCL